MLSEIWHGWGEARKPERQAEWRARKDELQAAAKQNMAAHRIFVAKVDSKRIRERLEAAIARSATNEQLDPALAQYMQAAMLSWRKLVRARHLLPAANQKIAMATNHSVIIQD